jgi:tetratricopeptide (TPR) repeat protein
MLNESKIEYGKISLAASVLFRWLSWFSWDRAGLMVSTLALAIGAIQPWYKLPPATLEAFEASLSIANLGRVIAAIFACLNLVLIFRPSASRRAHRVSYWCGFAIVLFFPYFATTWMPTIDYISASIYTQEARVTAHVKMNTNQIQAQWKQNIQLTSSTPITSTFDLYFSNARFFQPASWDRIWKSGFGYSRSFLAYIGRGWMMAGLGFGIGLAALYLGLREGSFQIFLRDMSKFLPGLAIVFGILVSSVLLPGMVNYQLDAMFARGEYHQVMAVSQFLSSFYLPLRSDEAFLKRMAEAGFYGNQPDQSLISFAKGVERYRLRDLAKAENFFQESLALNPSRAVVRGYLAAAILNQAVKYYNTSYNTEVPNTRKPGTAIDEFERVLQVFPGHIEAMYDLMLATFVNGETERSAKVAREIIEVERYAQLPNLSLLGQAYLHSAWSTYKDGDPALAWQKFRQSTDTKTWDREFVEEEEP